MEAVKEWFPFQYEDNPDERNIALIKLNTPFNGYRHIFTTLWKKAVVRAVVDGAVNELYTCPDMLTDDYIPDLITGDFDSARSDVLDFYRSKNVQILPTPDQMATDFTKCMKILCEKIIKEKLQVSCIYAHVAFDGRFDHIMANVNTLFLVRRITDIPLYLTSGGSTAFLVGKGESRVNVGPRAVGSFCGLVPISGSCENVTTSGLKYNLDHQGMSFGGLVSTSNTISSDVITIDTDNYILVSISKKGATT